MGAHYAGEQRVHELTAEIAERRFAGRRNRSGKVPARQLDYDVKYAPYAAAELSRPPLPRRGR